MAKRFTIDRILCPTDCTELSQAAMRRAVNLARWFGARVTALHVMPTLPPPVSGMTYGGYISLSVEKIEQWSCGESTALDYFVAPFLAQGVAIATRVVRSEDDVPWAAIRSAAEEISADLIVMGTHGRTGIDHFLMGSVAEEVLRKAPCPVMIAGGPEDHADATRLFSRIVCATDLTASSRDTIDTALALSEESLARLILLHVVQVVRGDTSMDLFRPVPDSEVFRYALIERAEARLADLAETAPTLADVGWKVRIGKPWEETVRFAAATEADLIVVGVHDYGAFGRLFGGSTANEVVRHAPCPVLVAREGAHVASGFVSVAGASAR